MSINSPTADLAGRRVTVMGLGRHGGGVGVTKYLADRDARVTVTDTAGKEALLAATRQLKNVPIGAMHLAGHREIDFRSAEIVVANPAVREDDWFLRLARQAGATITSEIELFISACPAPIIGVTGTNGKSTTAAMIDQILRADGRRTWLGGNIGGSLLGDLPRMTAEDWVVLELSSFQLARLSKNVRGVDVAVVTNFTPNHLDWHGDLRHYERSKRRILSLQSPQGVTVLNGDDPRVASWNESAQGRVVVTSQSTELPELRLAGEHNRCNARCAAAAARAVGCQETSIREALLTFAGLPHRIELVRETAGRRFINDSMATTPESTIAALHAAKRPTWLLAGGHSKGADFSSLGKAVSRYARGAAFYGAARGELHASLKSASQNFPHVVVETLDEAVTWCYANSRPGDDLLLSPACASYDQFTDYEHRAATFVELVDQLETGETTQ
jgi:UDP-N-acetylmuramoylalanine--D-glutamate ligase